MNPAEQHQTFIAAMQATRDHREGEIGKHIWEEHLDQYGPSGYIMDIVGNAERLAAILWPAVGGLGDLTPKQVEQVLDKLKDLGNYAGFTYEWIVQNLVPVMHEHSAECLDC